MRYFEPNLDPTPKMNDIPKLSNPQPKLKIKIGITSGIKNPHLLGNALKAHA